MTRWLPELQCILALTNMLLEGEETQRLYLAVTSFGGEDKVRAKREVYKASNLMLVDGGRVVPRNKYISAEHISILEKIKLLRQYNEEHGHIDDHWNTIKMKKIRSAKRGFKSHGILLSSDIDTLNLLGFIWDVHKTSFMGYV